MELFFICVAKFVLHRFRDISIGKLFSVVGQAVGIVLQIAVSMVAMELINIA